MAKRICKKCGYIYNERKEKIKFSKLHKDWKCPSCGTSKSNVTEMHILPKMGIMFLLFIVVCYFIYFYVEIRKPKEIDLYLTNNNISNLYSSIYNIKNDNISYMWYLNDKNIAYNKNTKLSKNIKNNNLDLVILEINDLLNQYKKKYRNIKINLYISDNMNWIEYETLVKNNIDYSVLYFTSGVDSYNYDYVFSKENSYDAIRGYQTLLEQMLKKKNWDKETLLDRNLLLVSAMRKNAKYLLEYPEYIKYGSTLTKLEYKKINFVKTNLYQEFHKLDTIQREYLFKKMNIDNKINNYFNNLEKNYLALVGNLTHKEIQDIKRSYSEYQTFYLGEYIDENYLALLASENIDIINMDFSLFNMLFDKVKIGGRINNEFITLDNNNLLFVIKDKVNYPLDLIFKMDIYN